MKPSERIKEIETELKNTKYKNSPSMSFGAVLELERQAVIQYLDEEWEKNQPCKHLSNISKETSVEERFNDIFHKHWKEPEFGFESYDNLVKHVQEWQKLILAFIKEEKLKSWHEGYDQGIEKIEQIEHQELDAIAAFKQRMREKINNLPCRGEAIFDNGCNDIGLARSEVLSILEEEK